MLAGPIGSIRLDVKVGDYNGAPAETHKCLHYCYCWFPHKQVPSDRPFPARTTATSSSSRSLRRRSGTHGTWFRQIDVLRDSRLSHRGSRRCSAVIAAGNVNVIRLAFLDVTLRVRKGKEGGRADGRTRNLTDPSRLVNDRCSFSKQE